MIKRVAAIGRNHNIVGRLNLDHHLFPYRIKPNFMGRQHISCKYARNFVLCIEGHIEEKGRIGQKRYFTHLFPDGITFSDTPRCLWIRDHFAPVIGEHTFSPGQSG